MMNDIYGKGEEIKNKVNDLYSTTKEKLSDAYEGTKEKTEKIVDDLGNKASNLYESGKEGVHCAEESLEEYVDGMAQCIKKQPLTSVLIAAGIGYLFAKFIK
ncbi:DUF883 family protein [Legionella saoudiensis]|uniref:DUF883 family protein n=1 Tax=Legionella saoudiensis TaxID=1750561 RepID=UPI00122E1486|nr:YtxH domain-containing protein [Legionella saoudiensis]